MTTTEPTTTTTTPSAWIGCLACYNSGKLRGRWITARTAADEMGDDDTPRNITYGGQAEPATYPNGRTYFACRVCGGDEWDVFDTEHLPHKMDAGTFYSYAEQLADLDDAGDLDRINVLASWLGGSMSLDDLIRYDDENYCGEWSTFTDYAESYADEVALLADAPEWISRYFDMEAFARDLAHDFYHDETTGHIWRSV